MFTSFRPYILKEYVRCMNDPDMQALLRFMYKTHLEPAKVCVRFGSTWQCMLQYRSVSQSHLYFTYKVDEGGNVIEPSEKDQLMSIVQQNLLLAK